MFDPLTGLSTNNEWVGQLTQPGNQSRFNVSNLFGQPLGMNDTPWWYYSNQVPSYLYSGVPTFNYTSLLGTGNYAANQALGLINGIYNNGGGYGLGALANQSIVYNSGLQSLPYGGW